MMRLVLTGLVLTKLDGTAKGGVICAIAKERPIPVYASLVLVKVLMIYVLSQPKIMLVHYWTKW